MEVEGGGEVSQLARPPRRPDVDTVRVALTWGILLFHTTVAYAPGMTWYVKSFGWGQGADWVSTAWVLFMDIWQMPMFFFLSGVSAYFALFQRTERQFREERVHRLLVPWLVLCLLNGLYSIAWLAPLTPNCEAAYRGEAGNSSTSGIEWTHCENYWVLTKNTSFTKYLLDHYAGGPNAGQGWFLLYLFAYSQVLASILCLWHPNHGPMDTACCSVPQASKVRGSMCFFFRPATTPEELVTAVLWWLGHPIKLAFYPILAFLLPELVGRNPNFLGNLFVDWANNFNYTFIFLFGYAITAADQSGMKEVLKKGRWLCLGLGFFVSVPLSFSWYLESMIYSDSLRTAYWIAKCMLRAAGEWNLVLGVYSVMREFVTQQYHHLPFLSEIAMPFYLTHQQVLVALLSASLGVPVLGSFPIMQLLATLVTATISFAIMKLGLLRYWFGLSPPKQSLLPETVLGEFLPLTVLLVVVVLVTSIQAV